MDPIFIGLQVFFLKILISIAILFVSGVVCVRSLWIVYIYGGDEEYYETSKDAISIIGKYLITHHREKNLLYDFGSSQGDFLFGLLRVCKNLRTVGVEQDRFKMIYAHLKSIFKYRRHKPIFLRQDFMKTDIHEADIIFIYVPRVLLPKIKIKLQRELKENALVIVYKISFIDWLPFESIDVDYIKGVAKNKVFMYRNSVPVL